MQNRYSRPWIDRLGIYFPGKHSWEWFQSLMEFPAIACSVFHSFANNHQPLALFWPPTRPSAARIRPSAATWGSESSTGTGVWVAVPRDFWKEEKKGWWEVREVGEEDLPADWAKHNVIQTPRGQKDAGGGRGVERPVLQTAEERWR